MASHARLHAERIGRLRQHRSASPVLLARRVVGLLLSHTVWFDGWKTMLPPGHGLAASEQQRDQHWLSRRQIEIEALDGPVILRTLQH